MIKIGAKPWQYDLSAVEYEAEIEEITAYHLRRGHHKIRRQVKCGNGRVDIFDQTTSEIIECKLMAMLIPSGRHR